MQHKDRNNSESVRKPNTTNNRHDVLQDAEVKTADKDLTNSDNKGNTRK